MSIQYTYNSLAAVIQSYAEDDEPKFISAIDDFIAKAETRVLRDLDLELFEQWLEVTVSGGSRTVSKPTDVIEVNDLFVRNPSDQKWTEVPRRSFEYCISYAPIESVTGVPKFYSEYDEDFVYIVPTPDQSYASGNARIRATIRPVGLSASNQSTFLSSNFADMLYQACMIEAYEFLKHPAKVQGAATKYQSLIPSLAKEVEDIVRKHYKGLNSKQGADE